MIHVGIDDTDSLDSRGTNKLARALAVRVERHFRCLQIVRHQLLFDARIPFTSHNGSVSLCFEARGTASVEELFQELIAGMRADFIVGSDPGLCVFEGHDVPAELIGWGRRCQREIVDQSEARQLAERHRIRMIGLGGTEGGVIGALAAIGLGATGDDGRIISWRDWPDDLSGPTAVKKLIARQIEVRCLKHSDADNPQPRPEQGTSITAGLVDVGKHARPNLRGNRPVLFVTRASEAPEEFVSLKIK